MTQILAVVVSFGSGPQIAELLPTMRAETAVLTVRIANNAVGDDLTPFVAPPAAALEMGSNLGYGAAVNETVRREARHPDWVLVVNPDVTFHSGAIDELLRVGQSDREIAVVGPLILTAAGAVYPSARRLPSLRTGVGHALFSRIWPGNPWTHRYLSDRELPPRQRDAGWLSGACLLVRGTIFEQLGGFDEGFFMYCEDKDLCRRIVDAGYLVRYDPRVTCVHIGGLSAPRASLLPALAASRIRFGRKHMTRAGAGLERAGIALGALTHALASRRGAEMRAGYARALAGALRPSHTSSGSTEIPTDGRS